MLCLNFYYYSCNKCIPNTYVLCVCVCVEQYTNIYNIYYIRLLKYKPTICFFFVHLAHCRNIDRYCVLKHTQPVPRCTMPPADYGLSNISYSYFFFSVFLVQWMDVMWCFYNALPAVVFTRFNTMSMSDSDEKKGKKRK